MQKWVCQCQCVAGENVSNKLLLQLSLCSLCSTSLSCCVGSQSFRSLLNFSWPRLSVGLFLLLVLLACLSGPGCLSRPPHGHGITKPHCCEAAGPVLPSQMLLWVSWALQDLGSVRTRVTCPARGRGLEDHVPWPWGMQTARKGTQGSHAWVSSVLWSELLGPGQFSGDSHILLC